jgi:hypothetical protein
MAPTARLMLLTALLVVSIAACWPLAGLGTPTQPLLSQHSQPAVRLPAKMVAIVPGGKTFHDPQCTFMHGHPQMVTAEAAAKMGYSPCTRCMRESLAVNP